MCALGILILERRPPSVRHPAPPLRERLTPLDCTGHACARRALLRREPQERSPLNHLAREYPAWRASQLVAAEALRVE